MARSLMDPETDGLIKLGLRDIREIEAGRMKPEDSLYLPPGTTVKDGKVALPPTGVGAALTLAAGAAGSVAIGYGAFTLGGLALALLFAYARAGLIYEVRGVPLYLPLALAISCLALGAVFLWAREIRKWRSVAIAQVASAVAAGVASYLTTPDPVAKWVVFAAASVAVADALNNLRKRREEAQPS